MSTASMPDSRSPTHGSSGLAARAWAICAKDATQELRRRVAIVAVFFFAATALALVSFAIGPFGLPEEERPALQAALLWIILFFAAATGLPQVLVRVRGPAGEGDLSLVVFDRLRPPREQEVHLAIRLVERHEDGRPPQRSTLPPRLCGAGQLPPDLVPD